MAAKRERPKKTTTKVKKVSKKPQRGGVSSVVGLNLTLTEGYILVEQLEAQQQTDSGIYLPDSAGEKPQSGKVLFVGPDLVTESGVMKKSPAKVGDKIIFKKWGGNEVKFGSKEYLFVKFEDILAVEK